MSIVARGLLAEGCEEVLDRLGVERDLELLPQLAVEGGVGGLVREDRELGLAALDLDRADALVVVEDLPHPVFDRLAVGEHGGGAMHHDRERLVAEGREESAHDFS